MGFQKASSITENAPFKASVYGPQGSGKTFTSLLFAEALAKRRGKRVAVIDTERGSRFYAKAAPRNVHPDPFDFDVIFTQSLATILEELTKLDPNVHSCVVIDSMSHLWDAAFDAWKAANPGREPELRDWAKLKRPYKQIMRWVNSTACDVILCGRQKAVFDEDDRGKLQKAGVAMRAEGETQYEPDFNFRMELEGKRGENCTPTMFVEKDRTGILAGRWYESPSGKTIEPLFPFLGADAPKIEDPDERADKDAALADAEDAKTEEKAATSKRIFDEFSERIKVAKDMTELGQVASELKKLKRKLASEHYEALLTIYKLKAEELTPKVQ